MAVYFPTTAPLPQSRLQPRYLPDERRQAMIIMGIPVDNLTMYETINRIESFVHKGRRSGKTHQIATVNTDFLVRSLDDENLRQLLQEADMCTPDGMPLVWGSRLLGAPLKERVAGSDMVPLLAERAAAQGLTLYLLGGKPGIADTAAQKLQQRYPGLQIVGTACPFWQPGEAFDPDVIADIRASDPDILLVAFGNPKQELWIQQYAADVGVPAQIGVGASLDFIAGVIKRAPYWMRQSGLEWLARLLQEPRRLWKRYARDIVKFGPSLLTQWWLMRSSQTTGPFTIDTRTIGHLSIINVSGALTGRRSVRLLRVGQRAISRQPNLAINLADVDAIDCLAISALMELKKSVEAQGGELRLVGIQRPLRRIFQLLNLFGFFNIGNDNLIKGVPA